MKGILHNKNNQWFVMYSPVTSSYERWPVNLPVSPEDSDMISNEYDFLKNKDSDILDCPNVEFEKLNEMEPYVKLLKIENS